MPDHNTQRNTHTHTYKQYSISMYVIYEIYMTEELQERDRQTDRETERGHSGLNEAVINEAGMSHRSCGVGAAHHLPLMELQRFITDEMVI